MAGPTGVKKNLIPILSVALVRLRDPHPHAEEFVIGTGIIANVDTVQKAHFRPAAHTERSNPSDWRQTPRR
jgi:hypothetical protein